MESITSKIKYLEVFTTIDQCVAYLERVGCHWTYEKERQLQENWRYVYNNTLVIYDPYELLTTDN